MRIIPSAPRWVINLAALWFSQLLVLAGFAAMIPFIPLFIKNHLHVTDPGELASAITLFNVGGTLAYAIFCPIWGKLADRFGVKPMLIRGTFLTCFLFPIMAYVPNAGWLIFLRFLSAACAGTTAASQTMLVRTTPEHRQGLALGTLTTAIWGGSMLGTVIGGMVIHYFNYEYAFWFCGITYLLAGFVILLTKDDKAAAAKAAASRKRQGAFSSLVPRFTNQVWIMLLLFIIYGTIRNIEVPYVALKIEELAGAEKAAYWTGVICAFAGFGAVISGIVSGYLADKYPVKKLMIPMMLISAFALLLQGYANSLITFAISRNLLYLVAGGLHPMLQKVLSKITPKRKRGTVFGAAVTANSFGSMLAAAIGGGIFAIATVSNAVFYFSGVIYFLVLPLFIRMITVALRKVRFHRR